MGFTILIYVMSTVTVTNCNFLYIARCSYYISSAGARSCVSLGCMARENKNDEHI